VPLAARATYTVFFTDLVGSTAQRTRLGDDVGDALRREHDDIVTRTVSSHGGDVVKGTGDGMLAAFLGAAEALACAVAIQQAIDLRNREADEPLELRVGISLGDARYESGDLHGTPIVEAARLCDRAEPGQILCADVVRTVAGSRAAQQFESVGALELKGLAAPLPTSAVGWEPIAAPAALGAVPLPGGLEPGTRFEFVGREAELDELVAGLKRAFEGEWGIALLAGEPGIGKTRLASEIAARAHADGALVLYGRCDDEIGVPYQPFVEALDFYVDHVGEGALRDGLGRFGGELARLVPHLAERAPGLPAPLSSDAETEQYRLFEAIAGWLAAASASQPVVLVLDDLHWAAKPTLLLMRHVARSSSEGRLLVVGTYRDSDLDRAHPLSEALADLRRIDRVFRVGLSGLDEAGVVEFLESTAGHPLDDDGLMLARAIRTETEGNPFFVGEVLRHLAETGQVFQQDGRWTTSGSVSDLGIPEGVREVIGRRLNRLSDQANEALALASVIGRSFELDVLARLGDLDEDALIEALDEAADARLVRETDVGRYSFSHALVRSALYDELRPTRRARLHRRVGEAIETVHASGLDEHLAELAYHYSRALASGDAEKAIEYARRAGDRSLTQLAHDDAVVHYEQARELLEDEGGDAHARCAILVSLGTAQRRAGIAAYRETLLLAAGAAEEVGDVELLAQAALANNRGFFSTAGGVDRERVAVVRRALDLVPDPEQSGVDGDWATRRARLLADLAVELIFAEPMEPRRALSDEAVAAARAIGDAPTLAHVLVKHVTAIWDASTLPERLAIHDELTELTDSIGDPYLQFFAAWYRHAACVEAGDFETADVALARMGALAADLGQATPQWLDGVARTCRVLLRGDHDGAEALASELAETGPRSGNDDAVFYSGVVLFAVRLEQGRSDELLELAETAPLLTDLPKIGVMPALALCVAGRDDEARRLIGELAEGGLATYPHDQIWSSLMWATALIATHLGERGLMVEAYEQLRPYEELLIYNGLVSFDSVASVLGTLATALGRNEDGARHFDVADAIATRIDAPGLLARVDARRAGAIIAAGVSMRS
jgi:class 3 adenylate cyclase